MLTFWAIYSPIVATVGLVMAFARTSPEEAQSKLSQWAEYFGLKKASKWLGDHALDGRILRYGKWVMIALMFVGAFWFGYLLQPSPKAQMGVSVNQQEDTVSQLRKLRYEQSITLGRATFFNMQNALSSLPPELKDHPPKQWVLISSVPENSALGQDLNALFYLSWSISRGALSPLNLPNYDRELDAPKFEGKALPGITIHGRTVASDFIANVLLNCFVIRRTAEMPSGISEYYTRAFPATITHDDGFIWLEIGNGSPWKGQPCIGPGN